MGTPPVSSVGLRDELSLQAGVQGGALVTAGRLIPVSLGAGAFGFNVLKGGASSLNRSTNLFPNPDKSGVLYLLTAKGELLTTSGVSVSVQTNFYGSTLGIRYMRSQPATTPDFCVVIDGVSYNVTGPQQNSGYTYGSEEHTGVALFTHLGDGVHDLEIVQTGAGTASATAADRTVYLYGLLVEERYGYFSPTPAYFCTAGTDVPTTAADIPYNLSQRTELAGIARVDYYNRNASQAVTVTLTKNSVVLNVINIPALGFASWTPPGPVANLGSPTIQHVSNFANVTTISYGPY